MQAYGSIRYATDGPQTSTPSWNGCGPWNDAVPEMKLPAASSVSVLLSSPAPRSGLPLASFSTGPFWILNCNAKPALVRALAYGKEREQFGRLVVSFEMVSFALATARTEIDAARLLAHRAAWLRDRGLPFTREASMAKLYASEAAREVDDDGVDGRPLDDSAPSLGVRSIDDRLPREAERRHCGCDRGRPGHGEQQLLELAHLSCSFRSVTSSTDARSPEA